MIITTHRACRDLSLKALRCRTVDERAPEPTFRQKSTSLLRPARFPREVFTARPGRRKPNPPLLNCSAAPEERLRKVETAISDMERFRKECASLLQRDAPDPFPLPEGCALPKIVPRPASHSVVVRLRSRGLKGIRTQRNLDPPAGRRNQISNLRQVSFQCVRRIRRRRGEIVSPFPSGPSTNRTTVVLQPQPPRNESHQQQQHERRHRTNSEIGVTIFRPRDQNARTERPLCVKGKVLIRVSDARRAPSTVRRRVIRLAEEKENARADVSSFNVTFGGESHGNQN